MGLGLVPPPTRKGTRAAFFCIGDAQCEAVAAEMAPLPS
jgi:hypothetical protein